MIKEGVSRCDFTLFLYILLPSIQFSKAFLTQPIFIINIFFNLMFLSQEDKEFISKNEDLSITDIAITLSNRKIGKERSNFILNQILGRRLSKKKIPEWYQNNEIIYPIHLSIEQASSYETAMYKTSLINKDDNYLIDLTGGLGVDFFYFAKKVQKATYVEQNTELCDIAKHNFKALGLNNYSVVNAKSEEFIEYILSADTIFIDPARRDNLGNKVFRIEDCTPNISEIQDTLISKAKKIIIKFSPMLDISSALKKLKGVSEVNIVSVDNECKEVLFVITETNKPIVYKTINIKKNMINEEFSFVYDDEIKLNIPYSNIVFKYLYEPNASILKAGAFKSISNDFNLDKLHPNSHLYSSNKLIENFPGRRFEVKNYFTPNKNNIKRYLSEINKANITVRNYPDSVSKIRKITNLKDGGDTYIFATTLEPNNKTWIICNKI